MSDETLKKEGFSKFWTKDKTQALLGTGLFRTGQSGRFFIIVLHGQKPGQYVKTDEPIQRYSRI